MNAKEQKKGIRCPVCDSSDIVAGEITFDEAGELYRKAECLFCDATWEDVYVLSSIANLEVGA